MTTDPLEQISAERFREALDQTFTLAVGDDAIEATLKEVKDVGSETPREGRAPFSLLFEGPGDVIIDQQICQVKNETLGELSIFLVTLGPAEGDEKPMRYEAVFA